MSMEIGVVGKPNTGKSTFFRAATLASAETGDYPFTTVEANRGVAFVRVPEPAAEFGVEPQPRNSVSISGYRFVPVEMIDVPGLVPGAHAGRGLGNRFMDELRRAPALVHVVDASGGTDAEGNPVKPGTHDPCEDVEFLEREVKLWYRSVLERNWSRVSRRLTLGGESLPRVLGEVLAGLGMGEKEVKLALREAQLSQPPGRWGEEELSALSEALWKTSRRMLIAANKADVGTAKQGIEALSRRFPERKVIPVSAMGELVLRELAERGVIRYVPGDGSFELLESPGEREKKALKIIKERVLEPYGSTGVQRVINTAVLELLGRIVVFPVADEHRLCDSEGRVLPDALLLEGGSTARELAYAIHTDLGERFVGAVDVRTGRRISAEEPLKHLDVIKIQVRP